MIKILLVDDHPVVRSGLKLLLNSRANMTVVGEACEGDEAISIALNVNPHLVIMDVSMPLGKDGLTATLELKKVLPKTHILILTMHDDDEYLFRAIQFGASGCILKSALHEELITAIETVAQGETYLYPSATQRLMDQVMENDRQLQTNTLKKLTRERTRSVNVHCKRVF